METKNCENNNTLHMDPKEMCNAAYASADLESKSSAAESSHNDMQEASQESLQCGSFFDRYIITDEVMGQGGQAFVTKGFDLQKQKYVAVKTYVKAQMDEHELDAARHEKQIMSQLDHQNIIGLTESYEDDYCLYLVMDMMADDLRNVMTSCDQAFDENTAKVLFRQMLDAVSYCHNRGIVHRDVKLENFFLDFQESDKQITVKLGDFGVA